MIISVFKAEFRRDFREMTSESFLGEEMVTGQLQEQRKNILRRNSLGKGGGIKGHGLFG